ncbi:MAG: flippase-like domain-containing protein, partial [Acidimicrobiia bacterium]
STPYFASTTDGGRLFVKVLTPEERAGDNMFRVFRMARLKGVGDERPFSSLKRAVEHEAVVSLKASADGVKTPDLEALAEIAPNSVVMAYSMIDGSSLDGVSDETLSDEVVQGIWSEVAVLRHRRTAHRDLRLANVFLDDEGTPWIIDFGFSELAATDGQLRSDIAELLVSTAEKIGSKRSVANAVAVLGPDPVADAAQRVQPLALSGATREGLKQHKGLDSDIREEIASQTDTPPADLEDLERVKGKTILMIVGFALAIYFLIPQLAQTDFGAILDADWKWAPAILVASFLTYVGAAWNIMGSVPDRIRLTPTVVAQFAGTFINRITPVKVGGMATNVRYLQKSGVDTPVAIAGIGVSSVGTFMVHISLLVMFVVFVGRNASDFIELPSGQAVLLGMVAVFTIAIGAWFLPVGRNILTEKVWPVIRRSGAGIVQVATSPKNALMLFGGAFVMIMSYITALWFSLEAFGGGLTFVGVAVVFLAGQALGQAAPTPGGIGATEAAMIAAMTALGLEASIAVPTVFLYRVATFWLPILPGFLALRKLESDGAL